MVSNYSNVLLKKMLNLYYVYWNYDGTGKVSCFKSVILPDWRGPKRTPICTCILILGNSYRNGQLYHRSTYNFLEIVLIISFLGQMTIKTFKHAMHFIVEENDICMIWLHQPDNSPHFTEGGGGTFRTLY